MLGAPPSGLQASGCGGDARRAWIAEALVAGLGVVVDVPVETDRHLDAFICALLARAVALEATTPVPGDAVEAARREGWIHQPTRPLAELTG